MVQTRIDVRHLNHLLQQLAAAQEESDGWREAVDEAKSTVEDLLRDAEAQYPLNLNYRNAKPPMSTPAGEPATFALDVYDVNDPSVVIGEFSMTLANAQDLVATLKEITSELE